MPLKFHPPVAHATLIDRDSKVAMEALLAAQAASVQQGGFAPICVRIDFFVGNPEGADVQLIKDSVDIFVRDREGSDALCQTREMMTPGVRAALGELLICLNDDFMLSELVSEYPLPWHDKAFQDRMQARYISVMYFGDGVQAVSQEYIPSYPVDLEKLMGPAAPAPARAEIFSICLDDTPSQHAKLQLVKALTAKHAAITAMFDNQTDCQDLKAADGSELAHIDLVFPADGGATPDLT